MPAPGDQHTAVANPFAEPRQRISEYTAQEIATLQSRLEKQLGPEYLSSRSGPGGSKVHYITSEKCIALANEVFGFNGWSSSIQNVTVDFFDEHPQSLKVSLGLSVIVRVTLRDGTYHEDVGYGHIENCRGKAAAFEKAKKEGTTDALKRALRHFGNVLGNCIYDKNYLAKVTKMKVTPPKFDENSLHRHSEHTVKKESVVGTEAPKEDTSVPLPPRPQLPSAESFEDFLGELDEADFNISEEGHPDEVVLTNSNDTDSNQPDVSDRSQNHAAGGASNTMHPPARQLARAGSGGGNLPRQPPQTPVQQQPSRPNTNNFPGAQPRGAPGGQRPPPQQFAQNRAAPQPANANQHPNPQAHMTPPPAAGHNMAAPAGEAVGFFSAKAVKHLPEDALANGTIAPKAGLAFNPKLESPSIRRTPGIDHSATKPLGRGGQHVPPKKTVYNDGDGADPPNDTAAAMGVPKRLTTSAAVGGGPQHQHQHHQPQAPPPPPQSRPPPGANVVNPQLDQTRRIGAPLTAAHSPMGNRGQFRPLTVKRPAGGSDGAGAPGAGTGVTGTGMGGADNGNGGNNARVPLGDVSSNAPVGAGGGGGGVMSGPEAKRQRFS